MMIPMTYHGVGEINIGPHCAMMKRLQRSDIISQGAFRCFNVALDKPP